MFRVVTCAVLLSLASAKILSRYTDCGGTHGTIHSIELTPCADKLLDCEVIPGHRYTAHINFTANEDTNTATNSIHGNIDGTFVPWGGYNSQECGQGLRCPVTAGLAQTYSASLVCPDAAEMGRLWASG